MPPSLRPTPCSGEGPPPGSDKAIRAPGSRHTRTHFCSQLALIGPRESLNCVAKAVWSAGKHPIRGQVSQVSQVSHALGDGPWGPCLSEGGSSDKATSARDPRVPQEDGSCPRARAEAGSGEPDKHPLSAWYLRPSHLLLTSTWPLPSPLLPVLTLRDTHSFTHSFLHQVSMEPFP